ncbi:hypothetical protein P3633_22275 [Vibrio parahaemolyticus]|nr:hypothetical protein [Vibrio furnissii]MDF5316559.1 hypothetical protein [Vibrio parahaemolyticus]
MKAVCGRLVYAAFTP